MSLKSEGDIIRATPKGMPSAYEEYCRNHARAQFGDDLIEQLEIRPLVDGGLYWLTLYRYREAQHLQAICTVCTAQRGAHNGQS
jgi:hypothetical protein